MRASFACERLEAMDGQATLRLLNVGGGSKAHAIPDYYARFEHLLLDIDPRGKPDVLCDARELETQEPSRFDAIYCSHNLEHYFRHDVPRVLKGFVHVLNDTGFAEIRVPDLGALFKTVVERGMDIEDILYVSKAGPIAVRDVIYGFGREIEQSGQDFYAHKTGFTQRSLTRVLIAGGFRYVLQRQGTQWELRVIAFKREPTPAQEALLQFSFGALRRKSEGQASAS